MPAAFWLTVIRHPAGSQKFFDNAPEILGRDRPKVFETDDACAVGDEYGGCAANVAEGLVERVSAHRHRGFVAYMSDECLDIVWVLAAS